MATALFVCLNNAGRSHMSAALFERASKGRHRALSAGSEADPNGRVHPQVVEVMRELGIDLSQRRPQRALRYLETVRTRKLRRAACFLVDSAVAEAPRDLIHSDGLCESA